MQIVFILMLLVAIVVAIVAFQNTTPVTLTLLFFEIIGVSVSLLILTSTAVGAILMMLLGLNGWVRNRRALRERDRTIARLEAELAGERARPVQVTNLPGPALPGPTTHHVDAEPA